MFSAPYRLAPLVAARLARHLNPALVVTLCGLTGRDQLFGGSCSLHFQGEVLGVRSTRAYRGVGTGGTFDPGLKFRTCLIVLYKLSGINQRFPNCGALPPGELLFLWGGELFVWGTYFKINTDAR
jgi:hypothetical protein